MNFYEKINKNEIYSKLNYAFSTNSSPFTYKYTEIDKSFSNDETKIKNGRYLNLNLADDGIDLINLPNKKFSYRDPKSLVSDVYPVLKTKLSELLMKNYNIQGDHDMYIFNSYIRDLSNKDYSGDEKDIVSRPQANYVHNDYSIDRLKHLRSGEYDDHLLDTMNCSEKADFRKKLLEKNYIFLNVWQPLGIITTNNMAFIDSNTINDSNFKKAKLIKNGSTSLILTLSFDKNTEAMYFPVMSNNEAVVFTQYSNNKDIPMIFHTAFDIDDNVYAVDLNRSSIEYRVGVFF